VGLERTPQSGDDWMESGEGGKRRLCFVLLRAFPWKQRGVEGELTFHLFVV
jgi:hypothetical protein